MLTNGDIRDLFGDVLGGIYTPGTLVTYVRSGTRDQNGEFPKTPTSTSVLAQRDRCTQKQMTQAGYSGKDVRLMVLQSGVAVVPDTDSEVLFLSERFAVMDVDQDPCGVYWDLRARLLP